MAHEKELAPAQTIPPGKAQPLQLADVWCDDGDDEPSREEWMDMSQAPAPASVLHLADEWKASDNNEELSLAHALLLADEWRDSDEVSSNNILKITLAQVFTSARSYGPEDFGFLEDDTFVDESSDEGEN